MFRLKRRATPSGKWLLVASAIGFGWFLYMNLSRPGGNSQPEASSEFVSISTNTTEPTSPEFAVESSVQSLKIATWNINYANRDLAEVSRMLRQSDADIVCLQETTEFSEAWLQRELAELFPYYFVAGHSGRFLAEGSMVLSRQPILEPRFVPPVRTFFGHVVFQADFSETRVTILSVHMTPFTTRDSSTIVELISAVNQTEIDHQHEVQAVLNDIPREAPALIVGDFNSPSHGIAPKTLKDSGLMDLFGELYSDADQTHKSWDFRLRNGLHATWRIDYIFYSDHFHPRSGSLLPSLGSDHHLLVAAFDCDETAATLLFGTPHESQH